MNAPAETRTSDGHPVGDCSTSLSRAATGHRPQPDKDLRPQTRPCSLKRQAESPCPRIRPAVLGGGHSAGPTPGTGRSRRGLWLSLTRLHFYAGVFVAPFVIVAALTGLLYARTSQLDRLLCGDELRLQQVTGAPRPLTGQVRAAMAARPERKAAKTLLPPSEEETPESR